MQQNIKLWIWNVYVHFCNGNVYCRAVDKVSVFIAVPSNTCIHREDFLRFISFSIYGPRAWTSVTRNVNFTTKVAFVEIRIMNLVGFFFIYKGIQYWWREDFLRFNIFFLYGFILGLSKNSVDRTYNFKSVHCNFIRLLRFFQWPFGK